MLNLMKTTLLLPLPLSPHALSPLPLIPSFFQQTFVDVPRKVTLGSFQNVLLKDRTLQPK